MIRPMRIPTHTHREAALGAASLRNDEEIA